MSAGRFTAPLRALPLAGICGLAAAGWRQVMTESCPRYHIMLPAAAPSSCGYSRILPPI
jgi:hypothetical protein